MRIPSLARSLFLSLVGLFAASAALAQVADITTWQVDTKHTGVNANETALDPGFIHTPGNFVPLFSEKVDGQVFAQPLYLSGVTSGKLPGGWADGKTHNNVVFVVTENATLYAFDADADSNYKPHTGSSNPIWTLHLVPSGNTSAVAIPKEDVNAADDITPLFGDTATPVIDPTKGIIYVVSSLKDKGTLPSTHPYEQLLWAIDVKSGQPVSVNGDNPVVISPQFNGQFAGNGSKPCPANQPPDTPNQGCEMDNEPLPTRPGTIPFYPLHSHLRTALTLDNFNGHNTLYLTYASHSDGTPYSGFVVGYDATSLQQTTTFTTTPDRTFESGIWMGGASPAIDPVLNKMYVITGNGANWDNLDSNSGTVPFTPLPPMGVDDRGDVFSRGTNWPMSVLAFDTTPAGTTTYRDFNELQVPFADTSVWFTPAQWNNFNNGDQDLGAGGPLLFDTQAPDGSTKHLLLGGGKSGIMFLLDRTNLGGIDTQDGAPPTNNSAPNFLTFENRNAVQQLNIAGLSTFNTPVFFNNHVYFSGGSIGVLSYPVGFSQLTNTYISTTSPDVSPVSQGGGVDKNAGVFISANGTSNGLVWQSANGIRAWDASNLSKGVIYTSGNVSTDDGAQAACQTPTFSLPIVSGGKAYFTCYQNPTQSGKFTTTNQDGTTNTTLFSTPADNQPGYLWVYGAPPLPAGAPAQVPVNVAAQADSDTQITVTWSDPDFGTPTAHTGFTIFRATCANNCTATAIATTQGQQTVFSDTGLNDNLLANPSPLSPNNTYFYTVRATNTAGTSNASNIASATTFQQYSQPGLVAYWPMDEGVQQGKNATASVDLTGNGHTAIKIPPPNELDSTSTGYIGGGWNFHGTNITDRLVVSNSAALQFTAQQSFSLVAWVNPLALNGYGILPNTPQEHGLDGASIIVKSRDQGSEYGLWINLDGQWEARTGTPGAPGTALTGGPATIGAWAQLALVQDGPHNQRYFYVNGQLKGTGPAEDASGGGDLWFGQQNLPDSSQQDGFQGFIDEVRIYNTVVTPAQLQADFSDPVYMATSVQSHAGTPIGIQLFPYGISGFPTTETRVAPNQTYTLQLNFAQPLSAAPTVVLNAQPGSTQPVQGSVQSATLDSSGMLLTVTLANVANAQALQLHVTGLASGASFNGSYDLPFNVLEGDIASDGVVDVADQAAINTLIANNNNNPINQVTSANAQFDLNLDGVVDQNDATKAQSLFGPILPLQADTNLAFLKQTSVSSVNGGNRPGNNIGPNAVDNTLNSRWESAQGVDPQSLVIDLNQTANIHSIILNWENAAGADYVLQTSNDPTVYPEATTPDCTTANTKWTTVVAVTGNTSPGLKTYSGLNGSGRFVRMCGTRRTTGFGYSLLDFEVVGSFPSANTAPVITSATSDTGTQGVAYRYTITSNPAAVSFGATNLPNGLTFDSTNGVISGIPTVSGTFSNIVLSATNSTGQTGTATLVLTISPAPTPVISSATIDTGMVNVAYHYTITSNPAAVSFTASPLPAGLILTGAVISGTPTTAGTTPINLTATNSTGQTGTATLVLTINPAPTPVITSATSDTGMVNVAYHYTITSSPAAVSFTANPLPAGLTLTGAVISGTPTTAGTTPLNLTATNSTGQTGTATLVLTINPAVVPPPAPPTGVTPTVISASQINLSWTASTTSGVTYSVFRSTTSGFTPSTANQVAGASNLTATTFSDSGLTASTTYFYIVEAISNGVSTQSAQVSATTLAATGPAPVTEVLAINAGSQTVVPNPNFSTQSFQGDTDFTGSTGTDVVGNTINVTAPGAAPQLVYQSAHQGNFTYTIPNLTTGQTYTVVLHFAELFFSQPAQRQFNVVVNGTQQVLTNFDIVGEAGSNFTAVVVTLPNIPAVNGQITLAFTGTTDQPMLNGIEVQTGGAPIPSAPTVLIATTVSTTQINLNWKASISSGVTYNVYRSTTPAFIPTAATTPIASNVQGNTYSDTGLTPQTMYYYIVEAVTAGGVSSPKSQHATALTLAPSNDAIAINAGGSMVVGQFLADKDFVGGGINTTTHPINTAGVVGAAPQALYQSARQGNLTYIIPASDLTVQKTNYTVVLHFAELFFSEAGKRVFNITINGTLVQPNFDILNTPGNNSNFTAVVLTFPNVQLVGGQIAISFTGVTDQPMVNGIEIQ